MIGFSKHITWQFKLDDLDLLQVEIHLNILSSLAAQDAYDIGRIAYLKARYDTTVDWMREALVLYENNEVTSSGDLPNKADILDHLAWSEYEVKKTAIFFIH